MYEKETESIVFFHPDLGIGGAERLVIDAAVGLQSLGHRVTIFTSHCDPTHCFEEARNGTLDVRVRGNSLIPPSIFGRFAILCAILRQLHLILQISVLSSELQNVKPTVFFVDQLSAGVPLLRLVYPSARILFYCHFPDKLLAKKGNWLKSLYRLPFDWIESWSTGCSDGIVVNSQFTRAVFSKVFPALAKREPSIVYPCVDTDAPRSEGDGDQVKALWEGTKVILSINRFEKKKEIELAIRAYAALTPQERIGTRLVIAGGYDSRVSENVTYHSSLDKLASSLQLPTATARTLPSALAIPSEISVLFLLNVPSSVKNILLRTATLLVYTPRNEHFGIVPLEAMLAGVPVLAANEGGPLETVVDGVTGWLRDAKRMEEWTAVMKSVLDGTVAESKLREMGRAGRKRVIAEFSKSRMATALEAEMRGLRHQGRPPVVGPTGTLIMLTALGWSLAFSGMVLYRMLY